MHPTASAVGGLSTRDARSPGGAAECSPRRQPWEDCQRVTRSAPEGRKPECHGSRKCRSSSCALPSLPLAFIAKPMARATGPLRSPLRAAPRKHEEHGRYRPCPCASIERTDNPPMSCESGLSNPKKAGGSAPTPEGSPVSPAVPLPVSLTPSRARALRSCVWPAADP